MLIALLLGGSLFPAYSQDSTDVAFESFQQVVTEIIEQTDNENDAEEISNQLYELAASPIEINSATTSDLERIFWLSEIQIQNLADYISRNKGLSSIYELAYIEGFTDKDARLLAPFIKIDSPGNEQLKYKRLSQRILLRTQRVLEKQQGYRMPDSITSSNHFTGSPAKYLARYNLEYGNKIQAGFTAENDAGEPFFTGNNKKGFDFYSGYLQVNNAKFVKHLIIGDYQLNFGQGLVCWSGFRIGNSAQVLNTMQHGNGINRSTAGDENRFFRGSATTLTYKNADITVFFSQHKIDGNVVADTSDDNNETVSSLQNTGYHTTQGEIADEKAVDALVTGAHLTYRLPHFEIGVTGLYHKYSKFISPEPALYNQYYFRGRENYNAGIDYRFRVKNFILFGEQAISQNTGMAFLNGMQVYVNQRLQMSMVHRYYMKNYQAQFSNGFGVNSQTQNEQGLYAGITFAPVQKVSFTGYFDLYSFPWVKYGVDLPSKGKEYSSQIVLQPNRKFQVNLQYRIRQKEENDAGDADHKNQIIQTTSQRVRYVLSYQATQSIRWQNRIEYTRYKKESGSASEGYFIGQNIEFAFAQLPLKFYLQYAIFSTKEYNSRVYVYENDLLYAFNIPSFYDKGSRSYVMVKAKLNKSADFWIKYSSTYYPNKETIGTGLYEIQGNQKSEIRLQLLVKI